VAPEEEFLLVGQRDNLLEIGWDLPPELVHQTRISHENHPIGDMWEHFWLPGVLEQKGTQVMHGPATLIPLHGGTYSKVVTIHDLVAFLFPDTIPRKYAMYMRWLIKRVVKRADRVISVSENTKNDMVQILNLDPDKITVVHEAAQPDFRVVKDKELIEATCRRYGINGPFIYHVGNIEPRKNLVRLMKAYLLLRDRLKGKVKLVITGQKGWLTKKLFRNLGGVDLSEDVIFTGYAPSSDLPVLMNAAEAFIFPSLYEGFGLPVLEAMSCGTPVVTSNISSLPEIVDDAAVLVDPYLEDSIAEGILNVLEDSDLRKDLKARGLAQSAKFSWEKAARETMQVYRGVYQERGNR
jgi:glycosyltransferase involved in cell wall biosynthesis